MHIDPVEQTVVDVIDASTRDDITLGFVLGFLARRLLRWFRFRRGLPTTFNKERENVQISDTIVQDREEAGS